MHWQNGFESPADIMVVELYLCCLHLRVRVSAEVGSIIQIWLFQLVPVIASSLSSNPPTTKVSLEIVRLFASNFTCRFDSTQDDKEILEILSHPSRWSTLDCLKYILRSRYDKRNKPTGQHMAVNISVLLLSLSSPSESSLVISVKYPAV